jgi:hypothetical protein
MFPHPTPVTVLSCLLFFLLFLLFAASVIMEFLH